MTLDKLIAARPTKKIYREGNLLIKLFDTDFSKSDILNEALNHARVEETQLLVPKIIEVKKIGDKWAIVMEYIEGNTLDELLVKHPEKEAEYLEKFVDLQLYMHSQKAPLLNKLRDKMDRKINEANIDATIRYELHTRLHGMPKHTKLCHGDFNPSNIIVTEDGKEYVIDWSHATQGNASADVARTYLLFKLAGKDELAENYLNLFCKKSDTAKQYVHKWLPIVAASQSVKGKADEREFLMHWVDVVEYE